MAGRSSTKEKDCSALGIKFHAAPRGVRSSAAFKGKPWGMLMWKLLSNETHKFKTNAKNNASANSPLLGGLLFAELSGIVFLVQI